MNFQGKYYPWMGSAIFIAIVLAVAYYIGTRTGKAKQAGASEDVLKKEIQKTELTFEQTQFVSMADKLETSLYGFGDDENAVYSVFSKLRTKSDLLNLIKTFGNRRIIWTIGSANLNTWINNRLSTAEIAHLNDILSRNGIDYQF
jgi:hypothetical protein